ncbi:DUF1353 domain-containing protein [Allomesorhizobium camelthorni]|uniref:DUF1353 domain-containing protein n=1 Tax=Allomesorhizobium camelthorni TaxID=475069 RepID=A0A6G4WGF7_9HYPH|nr:DUF1353 domain-containing protein [Mesorhizobium camelthorni]NGO53210.1 DUF1353 domain-containing protein [Mesorhizobium camelthorni]
MPVHFIGTVSVSWLTQPGADRDVKLDQDFGFEDSGGLVWTAKKKAIVNGASIPQIFWSTFGSPFIGDYRRASVLHDYYCEVRTRPSAATHLMFYEACLAGGVGPVKAKTMYIMVKTFGPSWTVVAESIVVNGHTVIEKGGMLTFSRTMPRAEFSEMIQWIETENPPIADIDAEIEKRAVVVPVLPLAELGIEVD